MGIFRTTIGVASWSNPSERTDIDDVMVDTGAEYSWISEEVLARLGVVPVRVDRFATADGRIIERNVGFAMLYVGGRSSPSIVVFAGPGEMTLLGAHGLEGLNLRVDLVTKELVPAGPVPAAAGGCMRRGVPRPILRNVQDSTEGWDGSLACARWTGDGSLHALTALV